MSDMLRQVDQWNTTPVDRIRELVSMFCSKLAEAVPEAPRAKQAATSIGVTSPFGSFRASKTPGQQGKSAPGLFGGLFGAPAADRLQGGLFGAPSQQLSEKGAGLF